MNEDNCVLSNDELVMVYYGFGEMAERYPEDYKRIMNIRDKIKKLNEIVKEKK